MTDKAWRVYSAAMKSLVPRVIEGLGCAAFVAVLGLCSSAWASAAKDDATRDYQLSLGGHALVTNSQVCNADGDVVGCTTGWFAGGLDLGVIGYQEPAFGLGGRFAMTTGFDTSGLGAQSHRQWLLRLMGEARWEDGGAESGGSLSISAGGAMLLDRLVSTSAAPGGFSTVSASQDRKATAAGPAVGAAVGYDFLVYDRLLLGLVLRAELMYLIDIKTIDLVGNTQSFSSGLTPLVELGMRMSMSQ